MRRQLVILFELALILTIPNKVLSQSKQQTNSLLKTIEDTTFFDLPDQDGLFIPMEQPPQFPGGDSALINYIIKNTIYPQTAIDDSITGKVIALFTVTTMGSTINIRILRSARPDLDKECIRVIKEMPIWKPGEVIRKTQKGYYWTKFNMQYSISFTFALDTLTSTTDRIIIRPKVAKHK